MINLLHYQFIQNAFLAGTIIAVVSAVIGYFVVLRAQAFAAHALAHIGFAGATGAVLLGLSSLTGTIIFTIFAAVGMGILGNRIKGRDIEIGMVLSFALGLGVLFLKLYTINASEAVGILFGSILSVTQNDLYLSMFSACITFSILLIIFRPLLFASIDPEVARGRGVPVGFLSLLFMVLLALAVAQAVLVVGILLVFALVIIPAATALHVTNHPIMTIIVSVVLGIVYTWGGLLCAIVFHGPVSFFIGGIASISYFLIVPFCHIIIPHVYKPLPHTDRELVKFK